MSESALVLTQDEWQQLAEICGRWINGNTNIYASDDKLEALAERIIEAAR